MIGLLFFNRKFDAKFRISKVTREWQVSGQKKTIRNVCTFYEESWFLYELREVSLRELIESRANNFHSGKNKNSIQFDWKILRLTYVWCCFDNKCEPKFRISYFDTFRLIIRHADIEIFIQFRMPNNTNIGNMKNAQISLEYRNYSRVYSCFLSILDRTRDSKRHCIDCVNVLWEEFSIDLCWVRTNEDESRDRDAMNRKLCELRRLNLASHLNQQQDL